VCVAHRVACPEWRAHVAPVPVALGQCSDDGHAQSSSLSPAARMAARVCPHAWSARAADVHTLLQTSALDVLVMGVRRLHVLLGQVRPVLKRIDSSLFALALALVLSFGSTEVPHLDWT
jgi:hypothetical protein